MQSKHAGPAGRHHTPTLVCLRCCPLGFNLTCESADPNASAMSSTVWWSSIQVSPVALTVRSKRPCDEIWSSMWFKNPTGVSATHLPVPSRSMVTSTLVSLVLRFTLPRRDGRAPLLRPLLLALLLVPAVVWLPSARALARADRCLRPVDWWQADEIRPDELHDVGPRQSPAAAFCVHACIVTC